MFRVQLHQSMAISGSENLVVSTRYKAHGRAMAQGISNFYGQKYGEPPFDPQKSPILNQRVSQQKMGTSKLPSGKLKHSY